MRDTRIDIHEDPFAESEGRMPYARSGTLRLFDRKFLRYRAYYISQCLLATLTILVVLLILDAVTQTVLISALGASAFICFTMPHVNSSRPRYLVGGYFVGTIVGCGISLLATQVEPGIVPGNAVQIMFAAVATGLAIFCMVITDTEHPPAAALAMGYVFNEWDILTVAVILTGIILLSMTKEIARKYLINLL